MSNIIEVPLASIAVGTDRARGLDQVWAEGLAAIIEQQGLFHPIVVRATPEGHALISGRHRLEAFRVLGREAIPAILSDASDDEARLAEVMENLGRNELIALDRCHHLYELKQVWERMYPQAAHGGDRKSDAIKSQSLALDPNAPEIFGFARATAEKIGLGVSSIKAAVKIWTTLVPTVRRDLVGTDLATKQTEMKALSELDAKKQMKVLALIKDEDHPDIKNVAGALEHIENGVTPNHFERRFEKASKVIAAMDDPLLDQVVAAHEARIIAALKRMGRI